MKHFFSLRPWILAAVVLASAGTTVAAQGKMEAYPANEKWFVSGSVGAGVYVGDYEDQRNNLRDFIFKHII